MGDEPRYGLADVYTYIAACFADLQKADPKHVRELRIRGPFADWEVEWFMRGCRDLDIFRVEPRPEPRTGFVASWVISEVFTNPDTSAINLHLFESGTPGTAGIRKVGGEVVTHLAAVSRLIGEYRQDISRVRTPQTDVEMDIVVYDRPPGEPGATPVIAGEVKVTREEMDELVVGMQACGGALDEAGHADAVVTKIGRAPHAKNHHKKCLWLRRSPACLLWAVSQDASRVFRVDHPTEDRFTLEEGGHDLLSSSRCD
jgi:hypothetical protein